MKKTLLLLYFTISSILVFGYDTKIDGINYNLDKTNRTAEITSSSAINGEERYPGTIIIPETIEYQGTTYAVTGIGYNAFEYSCATSISISKSIINIGEYAFCGCNKLTSLVVASDNPKYDSRNNCNAIIETKTNKLIFGFKSTIIPESVDTIAQLAFYNIYDLGNITIPEGVERINECAIAYCKGLRSISVPKSVDYLGTPFLYCCPDLESIIVDKNIKSYYGVNRVR